jgi:hypothetical protein
MQDMVRVAAIDAESLPKALLVLTAANNMAKQNSNQMLVFQPTVISSAAAAEPPRVPVGSIVMYTTQIMAGEESLVTKITCCKLHMATDSTPCLQVDAAWASHPQRKLPCSSAPSEAALTA